MCKGYFRSWIAFAFGAEFVWYSIHFFSCSLTVFTSKKKRENSRPFKKKRKKRKGKTKELPLTNYNSHTEYLFAVFYFFTIWGFRANFRSPDHPSGLVNWSKAGHRSTSGLGNLREIIFLTTWFQESSLDQLFGKQTHQPTGLTLRLMCLQVHWLLISWTLNMSRL